MTVELQSIRDAAIRIAPYVHRTPVMTCGSLDAMAGAKLFFKCENLQKIGAFKIRGATNAIFSLSDDEAARGVAAHSSGNHAQAVALAARWRGIPAYIVMPSNAPEVKKAAVEGYGGIITYCEPTLDAREKTTEQVMKETGAVLIHPYNDERVIAGQGTVALEFLEQTPDLDVLVAPVGGGGLMSGTLIVAHGLSLATKVYAAEPKAADDAKRSLMEGHIVPSVSPKTIADGLVTSLGPLTFEIIQKYVADIVTVEEAEIKQAMRHVWERMKLIIEPSSAVPVAAVLSGKIDLSGKRIGIIFSGGNVDLDRFFSGL